MPTAIPRASRRPALALWPSLLVAALLAAFAAAPVTLHAADAASTMLAACDGVNVRTTASTSGTAKAKLPVNTSVTVVATVSGSAYSTTCAGSVSGSQWVRISHVNGKTASSLYGVSYVYGASKLFKPAPNATAPATDDRFGSELTRLLNLDRQALGLAPMVVDAGLAAIARNAPFACPTNANLRPNGRAADLAARNYFAHTIKDCRKSDGTLYGAVEIVKSVFGYTGARSEILHWNSYASTASSYAIGCDINGANCKGGSTPTPYTVRIAQRNFMSSSVHRAAQLGAYERFGCGSATVPGSSKTYFACLFSNGGSTTATAPAPAPTTAPAPTPTATAMVARCAGVNLRTSASTSGAIKAKLAAGTPVTVNATVSGSSWSTVCGSSVSGSRWYRVTHVNGKSVSSLYGVSYLYAATGVLKAGPASGTSATAPEPTASATPATPTPTPATPAPTPEPTPAATPSPVAQPTPSPSPSPTPTTSPAPAGTTRVAACDGVNIRTSASTSGAIKVKLAAGTTVTTVATVSGSAWSTVCGGSSAGSGWYRITHVNGQSVATLYGSSSLYAATGTLTALPSLGSDGLTAIGASSTFHGRGWGHGVGLSQHGARGRALDGQDAATILAHYYPGTTLGDLAADTQVRVLVLDAWAATAASPLTIYGRAGTWTVDGLAPTFPANARLRAIPTVSGSVTAWRLVVNAPDGTILHDAPVSGSVRVRPAEATTQLQLLSKGSMYDHYRGVLRAILGAKVSVVNELPMDAYLRGVVPAEMPSSFPAEALKAQAVAARSYAAFRLQPGVGTFDLYDTTASQVYLGIKRETAATNAAIDATANRVLRSGSAIVNALFHSTGGGATEHNENVFTSATGARTAGVVSYLRGSSDRRPDGTPYDGGSPYATWSTSALTQAQLSAIFGADARTSVGTLRALDLRNRGVSGRLVSVTLYGSTGTKVVSGNVFVSVFNANRPAGSPLMRSSLTDIAPIP